MKLLVLIVLASFAGVCIGATGVEVLKASSEATGLRDWRDRRSRSRWLCQRVRSARPVDD
jgi:hypothetical protein